MSNKLTTSQLTWLTAHHLTEVPTCKMCANLVKWKYGPPRYSTYCSQRCCNSDPDKKTRVKETNLVRYGSVCSQQSPVVRSKSLITMKTRYGIGNLTNRTKSKQTCIQKYGTDNVLNLSSVRDQIKNTNIERYGVEWFLQSPKMRQLVYDKYGVFYSSQIHIKDINDTIDNEDWLYNQYVTKCKTAQQIAIEQMVDKMTILIRLHKYDIPIRYNVGYSIVCINWLESIQEQEGINIQHALNGGEYQIPGTKFKADGYCAETNTIYEFHGDRFHGNPKVFHADDKCHPYDNVITAGALYYHTIQREQEIVTAGYNLITMWEYDYYNIETN